MIKQEQIDILKEDAYKLYEFSDEDKDNEELVKIAMYYKKSSLVYASLRIQHLDSIKAYEHLLRSTQYFIQDPKVPSDEFLKGESNDSTPTSNLELFNRSYDYCIPVDEKIAKDLYDQGFISIEKYSENKTRLQEKEFRRIRRS